MTNNYCQSGNYCLTSNPLQFDCPNCGKRWMDGSRPVCTAAPVDVPSEAVSYVAELLRDRDDLNAKIELLQAALLRVVIEEQRLPHATPPWHQFVFDHDTFMEFARLAEDL
jgi:hypothetical protein